MSEKKYNMKIEPGKLKDIRTEFKGLSGKEILRRLNEWLEYYSYVEIEEVLEEE